LIVALDNEYKATSGDLYWDDGDADDMITKKVFTYSTFTCEGVNCDKHYYSFDSIAIDNDLR